MKIKQLCALLPITASLAFAQSPYYTEHLDGAFTNNIWYTDGFGPLQWPSGVSGQAVRLYDCASSSGGSHCTTSTSSYGQEAAIATDADHTHSGWTVGTDIGYGNGQEDDTWYRFHVRPAPGFQATPGTQNSIIEWHVDHKTENDAAATGGVQAYSILVGVQADGATCPGTPAFCTTPGTNPRLFLQVPGGPTSNPNSAKRYFPFPSNSLLIDHWYDIVLHIFWSPSTTRGHVQWWVDGVLKTDVLTPTEYTRSDGTFSYGDSMGLYNYRLWANFASAVDGDEFVWGPSAASIGFSGAPAPPPTPPAITMFAATPSIPVVPGTSVSLVWTSTGGTTATLNGSPVALSGSQTFNPLTTTDYVLVVSNPAGPVSQTVTVSVGALPVISAFTATPSTVALGGSSVLALASTGGTSCSIDQGVGTVACNSSTSVSPVTSKLYTVTVGNGFGNKTAQVLVGVSISALVGASVVNGQVVIH